MLVGIFTSLAIIGFTSFAVYLDEYAQNFAESFRLQNISLIEAGETLELGARLEATKKSGSIVCILGDISGHTFYQFGPKKCEVSLTTRSVKLQSSGNNGISVNFILKLPWKLEMAFIGFVLLNIFVATIVIVWIRSFEQLKLNAETRLTSLARQVAHDIRSPLSALNVVANTLNTESPEKLQVISNALQRINEISNDLLKKGHDKIGPSSKIKSRNAPRLKTIELTKMIKQLVTEKELQYQDFTKIKIIADYETAHHISLAADQKELARALSNLINNSIEALPEQTGEVIISLREHRDWIQLSIRDNGCGIPAEVLQKLGEPGFSFGKNGSESGSGLGVFHAKKTVELLGGRFSMHSKVNEGTVVDMHLPKVTRS